MIVRLTTFGRHMTHTADDVTSRSWFEPLVSFLAIATVNALFWLAGLAPPFGPSFVSVQTVMYCLCWFALQRLYGSVISALMALGNKARHAYQRTS